MLNIGAGEIIFLLIVGLLVLGPKRLPELARGIGKFIRDFRRQTDDVRSMVEREFYKMDQEISQPMLPDNAQPKPPEGTVSNSPIPPLPEVTAPAPVETSFPGYPDHSGDELPPELPLESQPDAISEQTLAHNAGGVESTQTPVRNTETPEVAQTLPYVPPTTPPEKV